ncbi:MAG: phosphate acetyltransferase [Candidatus Lindowbacteria bacterium RIFCSPLOWO2_12_FULL_62_27]|nr:MAG: phosphate acetyltransferase [Candidatus Lindowbacteria bacterium RIFCSPLOWO2_02_FULL_62_12]OGH63115.1 MAG: phosphate acetyltransferase [Candidatus Lindowbacteria bacterium RIFCSPLOWO2_12_FULL_62_27]
MFLETVRWRASTLKKTIVMPEGSDARVLKAAAMARERGTVARVLLVGDPDAVRVAARDTGVRMADMEVADPLKDPRAAGLSSILYMRRRSKGMTEADAIQATRDPFMFGALLVASGAADGMVGGCSVPTAHMIRAGLWCIGCSDGVQTVSSFFVMIHPDPSLGHKGIFLFADCAVVVDPTPDQLCDIAVSTVRSAASLISDFPPRVAFLSFSTKGSAVHDRVTKVQSACDKFKSARPEVPADGELQLDAAIIPAVGASKAPGSAVAGRATVLVFPDLDSGNIGYKLTQRLAGAQAFGPILQGLAKPVNDLSRGASAEDIEAVIALTACQAQG